MNLGSGELIIILLVVLLVFGGAKLPQLARSLGQAKVEFEKGSAELHAPTTQPEQVTDAVTEATDVDAPDAESAQPDDSVTLSRSELEKLVDEKVRERTESPAPDPTTGSDSGSV